MKKLIFTIGLAGIIAFNTSAQIDTIPNAGFENWNTTGSYMEPQGWATTNPLSAGGFYAVTRSTDHYPVNVGNYSVRIENDTSLLLDLSGLGIIMPDTLSAPHPVFPITGHPTSFTGYYKFAQLNSDTMTILIQLYQNGSPVTTIGLEVTASVSNWTSFNLPIPSYTTADSAHIMIAAYHTGPLPTDRPRGNSVLYIDNLNFDSLITSVSAPISKNTLFNLFPNPVKNELNITTSFNENALFDIYDVLGKQIKSVELKGAFTKVSTDELSNGRYFYQIVNKKGVVINKGEFNVIR